MAASSVILGAMLWLGAWAYDTRRMTLHDARLRKVLAQTPTADRLSRGLEGEGSPLLGAATTEADVAKLAVAWGGRSREVVLAKAKSFSTVRAHRAGDVVYFLFFDQSGILRDYVLVK